MQQEKFFVIQCPHPKCFGEFECRIPILCHDCNLQEECIWQTVSRPELNLKVSCGDLAYEQLELLEALVGYYNEA